MINSFTNNCYCRRGSASGSSKKNTPRKISAGCSNLSACEKLFLHGILSGLLGSALLSIVSRLLSSVVLSRLSHTLAPWQWLVRLLRHFIGALATRRAHNRIRAFPPEGLWERAAAFTHGSSDKPEIPLTPQRVKKNHHFPSLQRRENTNSTQFNTSSLIYLR